MKNKIVAISKQKVLGKKFNVYGTFENPLFLAKEIAEWLEYDITKVGQMLKTIDDDEKTTSPIYYSGQVRNMWFLTEDGLYEVLMQSRKPIAKEFKKKIKALLKRIRINHFKLQAEKQTEEYKIIDKESKENQKSAMNVIQKALNLKGIKDVALDYIKANSIVNKITTDICGLPKMIKKSDMTGEMLKMRDDIMNDYKKLFEVLNDNTKVSEILKDKYKEIAGQVTINIKNMYITMSDKK